MRHIFLSFVFSCLCAPAWAALTYKVELAAPDALKSLLNDNLELVTLASDPDMDEATLTALLGETPTAAKRLLETAGYFNARVSVSRPATGQVEVSVEPGAAARIQTLHIDYRGAAQGSSELMQVESDLKTDWPLPVGAVFNQDAWDAGKKLAVRLLTLRAYPLAKLVESRAEVNPDSDQVVLDIVIDSGPRIEFGKIRIEGLQRYPESVVKGQADFMPGSLYSLEQLTVFQSALEEDAHFSSALVIPLTGEIRDGQLPILVRVVEVPRQKGEIGLTWDSDEGLGTRLGYEHYNIFRRGYTGSVLLDWKQSESSLNFGLALPRTRDGYSHSGNVSLKKSTVQNVARDTVEGGVWRLRQRGDIEARIGVEYVLDRETIGGVEDRNNQAVFATVGWTQRKLDDVMDPRNGYLLDGRLSSTLGTALSETAFVRGRARAAVYWSPHWMAGTWLVRGDVGEVWAQQTANVPSSLLFRVGGVNSVRGFEYESLGVAGPNGAVQGGRVMATGSLEYLFTVAPHWRVGLFHDMGNAAESWKQFELARSFGFGVRWLSPVAPIAFDIARGDTDQKWRWTMSLGLPF